MKLIKVVSIFFIAVVIFGCKSKFERNAGVISDERKLSEPIVETKSAPKPDSKAPVKSVPKAQPKLEREAVPIYFSNQGSPLVSVNEEFTSFDYEPIQYGGNNEFGFIDSKDKKYAYGNEFKNFAVIDVFFATDRKQNDGSSIKLLFGSERGELKYGYTRVSIPRDHKMGELEEPSIWKLQFREDPEKHVVMLDVTTLKKSHYFELISQSLENSTKKNAFIFVHGYNVTFEKAARRTAQMAYDLRFDGAPVFYSWPSHGNVSKYTFDEVNIKWAQDNIKKFLQDFSEKSNAESIYLIAHSMGSRALTRAYISLIKDDSALSSRFTEIILAAPDIDADVFIRDIAPALVQAGSPITLYASSKDIPLQASKLVHNHPRAGDSGKDIIIFPGIESIDSTNVETGFYGHSYYADERSVMSDMFYIFNGGLRASKRAGLNVIYSSNGKYWEFKK